MDLLLIVKLFFSLFSFNPRNMRWFNLKRVLVSIFVIPVFMCIFVMNRICLFLDHLLFPSFRNFKVEKSIFIISAPRSATTYLFHKLSAQRNQITSFKLWELIYAPSIIQKYLILVLARFDNFIGKPLQGVVLLLERITIPDFRAIHKIGLTLPEEDEVILLWNLSTVYLHFFFPDTTHFDDYFLFDNRVKPVLQKKIMKYYYRCVQRHCYVFNQNNEKYFLSKNPALMAKVRSLYSYFPDAIILNINRCPANTIPSTLALNNKLYSFFTSKKASEKINLQTKEILIEWYKMANKNLHKFYSSNLLEIDYKNLISQNEDTVDEICQKLKITMAETPYNKEKMKAETDHKSRNKYSTLSPIELNEILEEVPFLKKYC